MKYSLHSIKIYNVDPDTKYSNLTDTQRKIKGGKEPPSSSCATGRHVGM
jgi:hypothetical protein